jgi:hypothetical protein
VDTAFTRDKLGRYNLGSSTMLNVGRSVGSDSPVGSARSFLRFNLDEIPVGAEIRQSALRVALDKTWSGATSVFRIDLARVLSTWNESDLFWDNQPAYASPQQPLGSFAVLGPHSDRAEWDVTTLVRSWIEGVGGVQNFGMVLLGADGLGEQKPIFMSRESASEPVLVIRYIDRQGLRSGGQGQIGSSGQ